MKIKNQKSKINKITYRQYLALTHIFSKFDLDKKNPSKEEIKKIIGFKTDRMLDITLHSLVKKGLIKLIKRNEKDFIIDIPKENQHFISLLSDRLMLIKDYKTYEEIKPLKSLTTTKKPFDNVFQIPLTLGNLEKNLDFLNNERKIFHRWYTFLEDFPPSLVWNKLLEYKITPNHTVLDPFVGSGTTVIASKLFGANAVGIDVNPIATFVTGVKTKWNVNLKLLRNEIISILNDFYSVQNILERFRLKTKFMDFMPQMELNQWLKPKDQNAVAFLKERINEVEDKDIKNLFLLALIESAVESSNVSFCPGTSFYPFRNRPQFIESFTNKLKMIYEDLFRISKLGIKFDNNIKLYTEDCRKASEFLDSKVDFILCSPPYPNDLEYTRQTRLELFILDFVRNMEDIRRIKQKMVKGSTKLIFKESNSTQFVEKFKLIQRVSNKIGNALKNKKWGWDYPRMVREYFGDIYLTLMEFKQIMKPNSYALLVMGDQTFKNVLIPVGKIVMELANDLNFKHASTELLRVRRSTIHNIPLREEIVIIKN